MKKNLINNIVTSIMIFFVSVLYLLLFSVTTSPIYNCVEGDSSIFVALGKFANNGLIPYKDFFDHKGPIIYLIEWLGQYISENRIGIFVLQVTFLFATLLGVFSMFKLFYGNRKSFILMNVCLLLLNYYYFGNMIEEYCLPFLVWSYYVAVKYIINKDKDAEHKPQYSILYGITFMICALTRITNAIPLCTIVLVGFIILIQKRKIRNILLNIICFLWGLIIFIPIIIYLISNNCLNEMIYANFIFNFKYMVDNGTNGYYEIIKNMVIVLPMIGLLFVSIVSVRKDKENRKLAMTVLVTSIAAIIMQLKSEPFAHYLIIYLPTFALGIILLGKLRPILSSRKKIFAMILLGVGVIVVMRNLLVCKTAYETFTKNGFYQERYLEDKEVESYIGNDSKVIAYNVPARFYVNTDLRPCYRFFILQDWQCGKDKKLTDEFEKYLYSNEAEYIVVQWPNENKYQSIIDKNYQLTKETKSYRIYRREEYN